MFFTGYCGASIILAISLSESLLKIMKFFNLLYDTLIDRQFGATLQTAPIGDFQMGPVAGVAGEFSAPMHCLDQSDAIKLFQMHRTIWAYRTRSRYVVWVEPPSRAREMFGTRD